MRLASSNAILHTSWGDVRIAVRDGHVTSCELPPVDDPPARPLRIGKTRLAFALKSDRRALEEAARFARQALMGAALKRPPVDPLSLSRAGSPFARAVWRQLGQIKPGRTMSYGEVAERIGHPGAARAVGRACGQNPAPLFIPCHRVTAAGGALGGFSSGLAWKKQLLERERSACA